MVEIGSAARGDVFERPLVDQVEGRHVQPPRVRLDTERTDASGDIENALSAQRVEIEREVARVFVERAAKQHDFVEHEALFHAAGSIAGSRRSSKFKAQNKLQISEKLQAPRSGGSPNCLPGP